MSGEGVRKVLVGIALWAAIWGTAMAAVYVPLLMKYPWDGGHGYVPDPLAYGIVVYVYATSIGSALWLCNRLVRA